MFGLIGKFRSILFLLALLLGGPFLIWMGFDEARIAKAIADHGKSAQAEVESIEWKEKRRSGRESSFEANIQFTTEDGQQISKKLGIPSALGKKLRDAPDSEALTIPVKYLPENPNTVVSADETDDSAAMYGIGAAMLLGGIGLLAYRLRKKPQPVEAEAQPA